MRTPVGVVLARGALDGEEVTVELDPPRRGVRFGEVTGIHLASPGRRSVPCSVGEVCGGCQFQFATSGAQKDAKRSALNEVFARAGIQREVDQWHESEEQGWRTRVRLHGEPRGEGYALGFFRERSHSVVTGQECLQMSVAMRNFVSRLSSLLGEATRDRLVVDVAESDDGGFVVALGSEDGADLSVAGQVLVDAHSSLSLGGVVLRGTGRDDAHTFWGSPFAHHRVGSVRYRQHVLSFFQSNRFLLPALVARVSDALAGASRVVDLFAGGGLFSVPAAASGAHVDAVEWNPLACEDLRANLLDARVDARVWPESADTAAKDLKVRDCALLLDPPRSGVNGKTVAALLDRRRGLPSRIAYLSCDPSTLVRDLKPMLAAGFRIERFEGFDMFPTTFHIETLVTLAR